MECRSGIDILRIITLAISVCVILSTAGCGDSGLPSATHDQATAAAGNTVPSSGSAPSATSAPDSSPTDVHPTGAPPSDGDDWQLSVMTTDGEELCVFTKANITGADHLTFAYIDRFSSVYSTINNWPTSRFYAAEGCGVASILQAAGVYETAQTVTLRAADGYEASLTREQILNPQFYYPNVGENADDAVPVSPMIAYRWREGTDDVNEIRDDRPLFIFGQQTPFEHTNPAFVVGVTEIIIDFEPCGTWQAADTFPRPGNIEPDGTVKLQHPYFGLVKLHYTLDGSDPTTLSPMYNPSTYQTELNRPIVISEPTTIKVLVTGYGRNDSEIAVFEFWPET